MIIKNSLTSFCWLEMPINVNSAHLVTIKQKVSLQLLRLYLPFEYRLADMPLDIDLSVTPYLLPSLVKAFLETLVITGPGATLVTCTLEPNI